MFFLVTGASGVGKSTVRKLIAPEFDGVLEAIELGMLGSDPKWEIAWRHRMVERAVRRALDARRAGRHLLLCGDPVPPGEVWAAPSADQLDGFHVCLLDAGPTAQTARLRERGDDDRYLSHHVAFADWMRHHVLDPKHRPEVITGDCWPEMRWDRWVGSGDGPPWTRHVIETSRMQPFDGRRANPDLRPMGLHQWIRRLDGTAHGIRRVAGILRPQAVDAVVVYVSPDAHHGAEAVGPVDLVLGVQADARLEDVVLAGRRRQETAVVGVELVDAPAGLGLVEPVANRVVAKLDADVVGRGNQGVV